MTDTPSSDSNPQITSSLMHATIESTADGLLVVNTEGKIVLFNKKFVTMWQIPQEIVDTRDDDKAIAFVLDQLKDPDAFLNKVKELYATPEAESFDVLEFKDDRVFERYSQPQKVGDEVIGRVWSFRDVTDRKKIEKDLQRRMKELQAVIESTVNREVKMADLKAQIEEFKEKLSQASH